MYKAWIFIIILSLLSGCASSPTGNTNVSDSFMTETVPAPQKRKLVAIAGFENRSTYSADKLWDTSGQLLTTHLIDMSYFRVVEWEKMKQLFDWRDLSSMNIINSPEKRDEMRKILLCEYFLTGAVTYFDVSRESKVSALSKSKTFETTIRVDLSLQDAVTGEYLSAGNGEWTETQLFSGRKLGTWDPGSADKALNHAIRKALLNLTKKFNQRAWN